LQLLSATRAMPLRSSPPIASGIAELRRGQTDRALANIYIYMFIFNVFIEVNPKTRSYEHSEQARASHTNGTRDVPRCGALSLLQKPLDYRPLPVAALVVRCRAVFICRGAQATAHCGARCASQVFDSFARPLLAAPRG
jgi:hypothetical protein